MQRIDATELVGGVGEGELLWADIGLSFWGGVDPLDSNVIDHTHPLHNQKIAGKVVQKKRCIAVDCCTEECVSTLVPLSHWTDACLRPFPFLLFPLSYLSSLLFLK